MSSSTDPSDLSVLFSDIITSNHKFTVKLYKILTENENGNMFFSPFSIQVAMVLVYIGAAGKSAEEIATNLHFPKEKKHLLEGIKNILDQLEHPVLKVATEMFIEKQYKIKDSYKKEANHYLKCSSQLVDFEQAFEAARQFINSWVSERTNNKINDLLKPNVVTKDTKLILVNAIHFKDSWQSQFLSRNTINKPFHLTKEKSIDIPMMFQSKHFHYVDKDVYRALEIPYETEGFRMLILLPREIDGLSHLESMLADINFGALSASMTSTNKVDLYLPKFKLENSFELTKALQGLGIKSIFSDADFSGITDQDLVVSSVVHKAFVDVTEEGTEAAAATAIRCCLMSYTSMPDPVIIFEVDHPFIFYIIQNDILLFVGRYMGTS